MADTNNLRVPVLVERYLEWLRAKGLGASHQKNSRTTLQQFIDVTGDIRVASVTAAHIDRLLLAHPEWAASTRNKRMELLAAFFDWCRHRRYMPLSSDPMLSWRPQKAMQRRFLRIPASEWPALLDACEYPVMRALTATGLYLFLRIGEMRTLKIGHLHLSDNTLDIVRHKTGGIDTLPISTELEGELRPYLQWYAQQLAGDGLALRSSHYLFPPRQRETVRFTKGGGRLNPNRPQSAQQYLIREALQRAGHTVEVGDHEGWHTLRRSGARAFWDELSDQGSDYATRTVQAMLGHASATTTERYLGIDVDRTRRDRIVRGRSMFPSLAAGGNVTPLPRGRTNADDGERTGTGAG